MRPSNQLRKIIYGLLIVGLFGRVAACLPDPAGLGHLMRGATCAGLSVTGTGADLAEARERAYAGVDLISIRGGHHRTDIALAAQQNSHTDDRNAL